MGSDTYDFRHSDRPQTVPNHPRLKVNVKNGASGKLIIDGPCELEGTLNFASGRGTVHFAGYPSPPMHSATIKINIVLKGRDVLFYADEGFTSNGLRALVSGNRRKLTFGKDCMLAGDVEIRTTDNHAVFSTDTLEPVPSEGDIEIGNHVWLGLKSTVLKDCRIGDGAIVAIGSVVTRDVEPFTVVGGTPAKVLKRDASWTRQQSPSREDMLKVMEEFGKG
ncbi:MAG: hypothetical protein RIB50_10695 [Marinovum algicola]|uniref:hypothetical protein n=1 Tax=Marinovum algicola TaxID=42444 RepID=UPI0032ED55C3